MWRMIALLPVALAGCDRAPADASVSGPDRVAWSLLSGFAYQERMTLPADVAAFNGRRVEMIGYVYPTRQTRDIKEFILMRDPGTCCYGPQRQLTHFVIVRVVAGPGVNYTPQPIVVTGTLRVGEKWDG